VGRCGLGANSSDGNASWVWFPLYLQW